MPEKNYYSSKHWKAYIQRFKTARNYTCELCGKHHPRAKNKLEVHHKHYETLHNESFDDCVLLCKYCHKNIHRVDDFNIHLKKVSANIEEKTFKEFIKKYLTR